MIIAIAVVALGGLLAIVGIIMALLARRNNDDKNAATETAGAGRAVAAKLQTTSESSIKVEQRDMEEHGAVVAVSAKRSRRDENPAGKLVFIQDDESRRVVRFELEDLLRASAEVLGSGTFGASYKATLLDGTAVVVKRFKEMNGAGRRADFSEHMRRLGRLAHPNLHPVVASTTSSPCSLCPTATSSPPTSSSATTSSPSSRTTPSSPSSPRTTPPRSISSQVNCH